MELGKLGVFCFTDALRADGQPMSDWQALAALAPQ
jgi:hypothetical protein